MPAPLRLVALSGLPGRLDRDILVFGEHQQLGLEAVGGLAAAPRRHGQVIDDQLQPEMTLGDAADRRQEQSSGERHRHAGPLDMVGFNRAID